MATLMEKQTGKLLGLLAEGLMPCNLVLETSLADDYSRVEDTGSACTRTGVISLQSATLMIRPCDAAAVAAVLTSHTVRWPLISAPSYETSTLAQAPL